MPAEANVRRMPGADLDVSRMPAYWLLARVGKRVLRPGGLQLTRAMLAELAIGADDDVVELAPGVGGTTRLILEHRPRSYTGIERDADAADVVKALLREPTQTCRVGMAQQTGLAAESADVVIGEAFLTMQPEPARRAAVEEAYRVLRPGGRLGAHELALCPASLTSAEQERVRATLATPLHVGARPMIESDWRALFEGAGFQISTTRTAPMALLDPGRVVRDEGLARAARIAWNIVRDPRIRRRVKSIRAGFALAKPNLQALSFVATKPA